ncbi:MAG: DUF5011 domain-containing protein [bacterium]|nr:DUF5011 domain-containing protein [bacterium]
MSSFSILNIRKSLFKSAIALVSVVALNIGVSNAQYCVTGASSTTDEYMSDFKLIDAVSGVSLIANNTQQVANGVCAQYTDFTSILKPVNMSAGGRYTVSIQVSYCAAGVYTNQGFAWIDYNRSNTFEAGEGVAVTPTTGTSGVRYINYTFTVPCNINPGITRLRAMVSETTVLNNPNSACGTYTWGETEDYAVNLQLPSTVSADFATPSSVWVKSKVNFINSNPIGYIAHTWDANNDGSIEAANSVNFSYTWTTGGTKCVKLRSTNCLGSDSVVKCLTVNVPTVVPTANFVSNFTTIEQYGIVKMYDLSSNGPWKWKWEVYDSVTYANSLFYPSLTTGEVISNPNSNGSNEFSQNPEFYFSEPGCYAVVLTATNDVGSSAPKRKVCYITVTLPTNYYLGLGSYGPNLDNVVGSASGQIFDNGGVNLNYANGSGYGTRSYLQITPCNAKKINLTMTQLKFNGAGDKLSIYDGRNASSKLIVTWTVGSKCPQTVTALSGSMFILFESDGAGVDSGFTGFYKSELGPATLGNPDFVASTTPAYNSAPTKFANTTQNIVGVPTWEWTIDGDQVANNKKFNLDYTFYTDGKYNVCLEMKSCVGNSKTCQLIDVITPNKTTKLDIVASNRRPKSGIDLVTLNPVSDNANRWEWTIFPTTYTLMNPPANPSKFGTGYVRYYAADGDTIPKPIIKFTAPGCYTIALKAYNDNDTNATIKTVVKNKFICALNYCNPSSFILSSDIGINNVTLKDASNVLFSNNTTSGDAGYTNYSTTQSATLTYGKKYTVEVSRSTNLDSANRRAWIDWNIDGDFDDAGEEIFFETSNTNKSFSKTFEVPSLASAFEGQSIMRIATTFGKEVIPTCGPITAGEYEDYGIVLANDNSAPVITLIGNATERMEVNTTYTDAGATAFDLSEGDISSEIIMTSDLDPNTTGVYTIEYNVTDKSLNKAVSVKRIVIVEKDLTPPTLTLNPGSSGCFEADRTNAPYVDPGATARNTNPNQDLTSSIVVKGMVDTRKIGTYVLTYSVKDAAGNSASKTRTVCVSDTKKPSIGNIGDTSIQIGSTWIDQTIATDLYDLNPSLTKVWQSIPVNTAKRSTYTVTYSAVDQSGNVSDPVVVNYRVDDFIAPVISLNTFDVVEQEVNRPYKSIAATVSDNYYGPGQVSIALIFSNVDFTTLGTYKEIFRAVDGSGNITERTRTVKVIDTEAPVIYGETIYGCVGEDIWPFWGVTTTDNYYSPSDLKPFVEIVKQNVNPKQEGFYFITYRVTDPSGNVSLPFTVNVVYTYWPKCYNSTTGVKTLSAEESVTLYPNPTTGKVTIDLKGILSKNTVVEVYNAMGQKVISDNYSEALDLFNIDLSGSAKGVYTIKLIADGQTIIKRVVLQ